MKENKGFEKEGFEKVRLRKEAGSLQRGLSFLSIFILMLSFLALSACGNPWKTDPGKQNIGQDSSEEKGTGFTAAGLNSFDSADTAILMQKNKNESTVTFWNLTVGKSYTLSYDGTTQFYNKYGESLSLEQINPGDIVDVTFLKSKKHLTTLQISSETWNLEQVTYFEMGHRWGEVAVGQESQKLKITKNTKYFSEGRSIEAEELNPADTLSFQGIDSEVLTVKIERGHGYLRLSGDEKFIGGWIEIGQSQIQRITEDMLLPVPEGTYSVLVSKNGNEGEKTAVIRRNEETVLDISDLQVAEPEVGTILFSLTPASVKLYVDGEKVDTSAPVSLVYGIHQLIARADGYQTLTQYVRVGEPSAWLSITLDPVDTAEESTEKSTTVDTATDYYKVYIDAPEGVEVYLDGNYVGIAPCSFRKEAGSHVVILRKSGYIPKSYTLQINSEEKDISFSFPELEITGVGSSNIDNIDSLLSDMLGILTN